MPVPGIALSWIVVSCFKVCAMTSASLSSVSGPFFSLSILFILGYLGSSSSLESNWCHVSESLRRSEGVQFRSL